MNFSNDESPIQSIINMGPVSIIDQLNAYCQSDIKTLWTLKRLNTNHEICGFTYVENMDGDWELMPTLCQNCNQIITYIINNMNVYNRDNNNCETQTMSDKMSDITLNNLFPSPIIPLCNDTDYLLYSNNNHDTLPGLKPYKNKSSTKLSLNCCSIL